MRQESDRVEAVALDEARERIFEALRGLRYGAVEIQIHDSRIVRITRTEKVRVDAPLHRRKATP